LYGYINTIFLVLATIFFPTGYNNYTRTASYATKIQLFYIHTSPICVLVNSSTGMSYLQNQSRHTILVEKNISLEFTVDCIDSCLIG